MKFYEITYMMENEQHKRLSILAERYEKINGWSEKQLLQFAVTAVAHNDMEEKLKFLEEQIVQLEKEWQEHQKGSGQKQVYISDEEREKCRKVVNAYAGELDDEEVTVVEAGRFGFVKLAYYKFPNGFEDAITFTDSLTLFLDLWDEWFQAELVRLTKDMPMAELEYEEIFKNLPNGEREELMAKREYFAKKADLRIG